MYEVAGVQFSPSAVMFQETMSAAEPEIPDGVSKRMLPWIEILPASGLKSYS
jgi:hypothetical protein